MAQGDPLDGNIPLVPENDGLNFINLGPQYVIETTLIEGNIQRTLPEIHIPRRLTTDDDFYLEMIRRSLTELCQYSLVPGPEYNPLLSMLAWNADYWSIDVSAAGSSDDIAFYPVYINSPPPEPAQTSMSESSTEQGNSGDDSQDENHSDTASHSHDDEQPGPSHLVNNRSEIRSGRSTTPFNQSSESQTELRQGVKRKRKTSGRSESRGQKRKRSDIDSSPPASPEETFRDDEQPGPSHQVSNREIRKPAERQAEMREGMKRKRKTSDRSESREVKKRRSDHLSESDLDDERPGPSHRDNSELRAPADQVSLEQRGKRKRETCASFSGSEDGPDSSNDLFCSWDYPMFVYSLPLKCRETTIDLSSLDDEQPGPSQLVNTCEVRSGRSRTTADQSSGNQDESKQGGKRKRKTSGRSEGRGGKRRRSDHHSDSDPD